MNWKKLKDTTKLYPNVYWLLVQEKVDYTQTGFSDPVVRMLHIELDSEAKFLKVCDLSGEEVTSLKVLGWHEVEKPKLPCNISSFMSDS